MRTDYQKIGYSRVTSSGRCPVCGKPANRSNDGFYQTISPFNKREDGMMKTAEDIWKEVRSEADAWQKLPVYHAKCEKLK